MTNYERIKAMSVSELAEFLLNTDGYDGCSYCIHYNNLPVNAPLKQQCYWCDEEIAKSGIMQWLVNEVEK